MKIRYHKRFEKQFKKLPLKTKNKVIEVIEIFVSNPYDERLSNHSLKGALLGKKAISASFDIRIIFEEFDDYALVIFIDLGTHNRVYG